VRERTPRYSWCYSRILRQYWPVVAFAGISLGHLSGSPYFNGDASIVIGLILGGVAIWLAYETKGLLIRESANPEIARKTQGVKHVNEVLTMHIGPEFSW
jgi:divalent metal cation (Fe/Co/Zn/Cd) transporter